jgi:hypothetical protein
MSARAWLAVVALAAAGGLARAGELPVVAVRFSVIPVAHLRFADATVLRKVGDELTRVASQQLPYWTFRASTDGTELPRLDVAVDEAKEGGYELRIQPLGRDATAKAFKQAWILPGDVERGTVPNVSQWPSALALTFRHWIQEYRAQLLDELANVVPLSSEVDNMSRARGILPFKRDDYPCLCSASYRIDCWETREKRTITLHSRGTPEAMADPSDHRIVLRHRTWEDRLLEPPTRRDVDRDPPPGLDGGLKPIAVYVELRTENDDDKHGFGYREPPTTCRASTCRAFPEEEADLPAPKLFHGE